MRDSDPPFGFKELLMINPSTQCNPSFPYPIYLNGMHIEEDRALAARHQHDYQSGQAFSLALSDISWIEDLEATFEQMKREVPNYPASFYKLHLAERIAFALCVEHEQVSECVHLMMMQQNDPQMLQEVASIARRMQKHEAPEGYAWVSPADSHGVLRPIAQLLDIGVVSEIDMLDRALRHEHALVIVPSMIKSVSPPSAMLIRQSLKEKLLMSEDESAERFRSLLGLPIRMGTWEASQRFHLMFELAAPNVLDEYHLQPDTISANATEGVALQIRSLSGDCCYLNDLAQQDLAKVVGRMLFETALYADTEDGCLPINTDMMSPVIVFCLQEVRGARDLLINALLLDMAQGALYCPAPWESTPEQKLRQFIHETCGRLWLEPRHIQLRHQLGQLVLTTPTLP